MSLHVETSVFWMENKLMKIIISLFHYCKAPQWKCIGGCIFSGVIVISSMDKLLLGKIPYTCVCILFIYSYIYLGIRDVNQETSVLFLHLFTSNSLKNIHAVQYSVWIACCFYHLTGVVHIKEIYLCWKLSSCWKLPLAFKAMVSSNCSWIEITGACIHVSQGNLFWKCSSDRFLV